MKEWLIVFQNSSTKMNFQKFLIERQILSLSRGFRTPRLPKTSSLTLVIWLTLWMLGSNICQLCKPRLLKFKFQVKLAQASKLKKKSIPRCKEEIFCQNKLNYCLPGFQKHLFLKLSKMHQSQGKFKSLKDILETEVQQGSKLKHLARGQRAQLQSQVEAIVDSWWDSRIESKDQLWQTEWKLSKDLTTSFVIWIMMTQILIWKKWILLGSPALVWPNFRRWLIQTRLT